MTALQKNSSEGRLSAEAIRRLESQGCTSADWSRVSVSPAADLSLIRNVRFEGDVSVGRLMAGEGMNAGISDAVIADCRIGSQAEIRNIRQKLSGYCISDRVRIVDVGLMSGMPDARCGVGTEVSVLDETGSRAVRIFPGLSARLALLLALNPRWADDLDFDTHKAFSPSGQPYVGAGAEITGCGRITNVNVGREVRIEGALRLDNGTIVNNAPRGTCAAYIGYGVIASNFIVEDGVIDTGARVFSSYVGQCAVLSNGFTAHDSLFFANSHCENGEACAVIAGPYTVSMHKSSLLIGGVYSFMNAGSGTNFSNHMYKLGPVHCGISERGLKTASNAYLMWGARIGAFSLLMGDHKNHPDTSAFPFSYLFGDSEGNTVVAPARMLVSSGLMRDEKKWKLRDARQARRLPAIDNIDFRVLNPATVGKMIGAVEILRVLKPDADGIVRYGKLLMRPSSVEKGIRLYMLAIKKYFHEATAEEGMPSVYDTRAGEWTDLCGEVIPAGVAERVLKSETLAEAQELLDEATEESAIAERGWIAWKFTGSLLDEMKDATDAAAEFDSLREADKADYLEILQAEKKLLRL